MTFSPAHAAADTAERRLQKLQKAITQAPSLPGVMDTLNQLKPEGRVSTGKISSFTNAEGCKVIVLPGVKEKEVCALDPVNWKDKVYHYQAGRTRRGHGHVFTATTTDSEGKKFKLRCRAIRRHYRTTHEARMLLFLQENGFYVEQPLAVVTGPKTGRLLVTREIEGSPYYGPVSEVKEVKERLNQMGIKPEDLYEYGKPNYLFTRGMKPALVLVDVEHYHSEDPESKLHGSRMLRRKSKL